VLAACGGGADEDDIYTETPTQPETGTSTATPTQTETGISTATPTPVGPVKIGGITSWSGGAALAGLGFADPMIKLVTWQLKQQGGILGGRDLQVVKYDNRSSVAECAAGGKKLMYDDKVSALVFGGVNGAELQAVSEFAEENHILFVQMSAVEYPEKAKYTLSGAVSKQANVGRINGLLTKVLKPKTVAILAADMEDSHWRTQQYKDGLGPDVEIVYDQYASQTTLDFSPYLTKIKYENPDVLILDFGPAEAFITIAGQIMELGGWGDIKVVGLPGAGQAALRNGAQGWYQLSMWLPGLTHPGAVKFENDFTEVFGAKKKPNDVQVYFYNCLWTAIHCIEEAGTDTDLEAINDAAHSGKIEWDTPMGHAHYKPEYLGENGLIPLITQTVDKKLVIVEIPD